MGAVGASFTRLSGGRCLGWGNLRGRTGRYICGLNFIARTATASEEQAEGQQQDQTRIDGYPR